VEVTHWQNFCQLLERPLRRAVAMDVENGCRERLAISPRGETISYFRQPNWLE
jgi:hypothetical protein